MTFVVAELGVNWRNLAEADKMIRACKEEKADAVKFQMYSDEQIKDSPLYYVLKNIRLTEEDVRYLYWRCKEHRIEFMCTPMYPEAVDILTPYVTKWKIRYNDRHNQEILEKCLETDNDIFISCQNVTRRSRLEQINYLYCDPSYPPKKFPYMYEFKNMDGYSCHIPYVSHMISAVKECNLDIIEVHVKRDNYGDNYCPMDNRVSITVSELGRLTRSI